MSACPTSRRLTAVELPYGRKRALEIATTLALDPEMLLLDEPTAGMGHEDIDRIAALIKRVAADRTVLMVEHNLSVVANLSDRITVLTRGRVLAEGDYATVVEQSRGARSLHGDRPCLTSAAPLLAVKDLQAWYGESHILHGVTFDVRAGRSGDAARPQRRRQDHDAEVDHGHRRPAHRLGALRGPRADRRCRRTRSRGRASRSARRSAAFSRASTSRKT